MATRGVRGPGVVARLSWAAGFHDLLLPLVWIGGRSVLMPTGGTSLDRMAAAAVVGLPDERWGEVAVAVIVSSRPSLDLVLIDRLCREQLATYKCPRRIVLRDEPLPRTASGKVLKRELRPWVVEALAAAVDSA